MFSFSVFFLFFNSHSFPLFFFFFCGVLNWFSILNWWWGCSPPACGGRWRRWNFRGGLSGGTTWCTLCEGFGSASPHASGFRRQGCWSYGMMWGHVNMRIFVWCGRCWIEINQSLVILLGKVRTGITGNCSSGLGVLHIFAALDNHAVSLSPHRKRSPCYVIGVVWVLLQSRIKGYRGFHVEHGLLSPTNQLNHM